MSVRTSLGRSSVGGAFMRYVTVLPLILGAAACAGPAKNPRNGWKFPDETHALPSRSAPLPPLVPAVSGVLAPVTASFRDYSGEYYRKSDLLVHDGDGVASADYKG